MNFLKVNYNKDRKDYFVTMDMAGAYSNSKAKGMFLKKIGLEDNKENYEVLNKVIKETPYNLYKDILSFDSYFIHLLNNHNFMAKNLLETYFDKVNIALNFIAQKTLSTSNNLITKEFIELNKKEYGLSIINEENAKI